LLGSNAIIKPLKYKGNGAFHFFSMVDLGLAVANHVPTW
jgi:hypothetical protein